MKAWPFRPWALIACVCVALVAAGCGGKTETITKEVPTPMEQGVTITLSRSTPTATVVVDPPDAMVSKLPDELWQGKGNHLRWHNTSSWAITITFHSKTDWEDLFVEPYETAIVIPAGGRSAWYTVREGTGDGKTTPYTVSNGPPTEPGITDGP